MDYQDFLEKYYTNREYPGWRFYNNAITKDELKKIRIDNFKNYGYCFSILKTIDMYYSTRVSLSSNHVSKTYTEAELKHKLRTCAGL